METKQFNIFIQSFDEMLVKTVSKDIANREMIFRLISDSKHKNFTELINHKALKTIQQELCISDCNTKNLTLIDFALPIYKKLPPNVKMSHTLSRNKIKKLSQKEMMKDSRKHFIEKNNDIDRDYLNYIIALNNYFRSVKNCCSQFKKYFHLEINTLTKKETVLINKNDIIQLYSLNNDLSELSILLDQIDMDWIDLKTLKKDILIAQKKIVIYFITHHKQLKKFPKCQFHMAELHLKTWYDWTKQPHEEKQKFYKANPKLYQTWYQFNETLPSELKIIEGLIQTMTHCKSSKLTVSDFFVNASNRCLELLNCVLKTIPSSSNPFINLFTSLKKSLKNGCSIKNYLKPNIQLLSPTTQNVLIKFELNIPKLLCLANKSNLSKIIEFISKLIHFLESEFKKRCDGKLEIENYLYVIKNHFCKVIHSSSIIFNMKQ